MEKVRILHVIHSVTFGGAEQIVLNILSQYDRSLFHMDICTVGLKVGDRFQVAEQMDASVFYCPIRRKIPGFSKYIYSPLHFCLDFHKILKQEKYNVVHSHINLFSGLIMWIARLTGVPIRITHNHTLPTIYLKPGIIYSFIMRYLINRFSTLGLGISNLSMPALFGNRWKENQKNRVLYWGIEPEKFCNHFSRKSARAEFFLSDKDYVVGHVGTFSAPKNHLFLIDIMAELAESEPRSRLLLIGEGHLRAEVELKAKKYGLLDRIIFAGARSDVPILLSAMDVFVFPSLYESYGLAVLEAQASGLRCVVSDSVSPEVSVVPGAVVHLPLNKNPTIWVNLIKDALSLGRIGSVYVNRFFTDSPFLIENSMNELQKIYLTQKT